MKIGFDFVQPSLSLAGCGWYTQSLLTEMAQLAPAHDFLAYRHFGEWFIAPENLAPLPCLPNISDPLAGCSLETTVQEWQQDLARGQAPGRPALVHSTSFQSPRLTSAKLVVTVFDLSFWAVPEYTTDDIRVRCQAGVLNALDHADGLIFISEHTRREFDRFLPSHRRRGKIDSIVTPLAARWPLWEGERLSTGAYWLFVGSLEPRKNLHNLLVAYTDYVRAHPAPKPLWLAGGSGWENASILKSLQPLEQQGLARRLGFVPDEQLAALYRGAQAVIFPSWYEGFGLPVLEAMTQGCPVICSSRTCLPETGGEAPFYIDPARPAEITNAMQQIEADAELRERLVLTGLHQAQKFSWKKVAKQTLAFYEQVLSTD